MQRVAAPTWADGLSDESYVRRRNLQTHCAGALGGPVFLDDSSMTKVDFMDGMTDNTIMVLARRVVRDAMPRLRGVSYSRRGVAYAAPSITSVPVSKMDALRTSPMTGDVKDLVAAVNRAMQTEFNTVAVIESGFPSRPCRINAEGLSERSDQLWLCMSEHRLRVILDRTAVHDFAVKPYEAFLCKGEAFGPRIQTHTMQPMVGLRINFYKYALYADFPAIRLH